MDAKWLSGIYLGLELGFHEMCVGAKKGVVRAAAVKRKTDRLRFAWGELNVVVGTPRRPTPADQQQGGEEVPAARYPVAAGGKEVPLPVRPVRLAGAGGGGGVAGPRRVYVRAIVEDGKYGVTLGCPGCDVILTGSGAKTQ